MIKAALLLLHDLAGHLGTLALGREDVDGLLADDLEGDGPRVRRRSPRPRDHRGIDLVDRFDLDARVQEDGPGAPFGGDDDLPLGRSAELGDVKGALDRSHALRGDGLRSIDTSRHSQPLSSEAMAAGVSAAFSTLKKTSRVVSPGSARTVWETGVKTRFPSFALAGGAGAVGSGAVAPAVWRNEVGRGMRGCVSACGFLRREPLVDHEVDDHAGDGDEEPRGKGESREALVFREVALRGGDDDEDDEGKVHHREEDVGDENREVNLPRDGILLRELGVARSVVIDEVTGEKEGRADQRRDHRRLVRLAFARLDQEEPGEKQHRAEAVEGGVDRGKDGIVEGGEQRGHGAGGGLRGGRSASFSSGSSTMRRSRRSRSTSIAPRCTFRTS